MAVWRSRDSNFQNEIAWRLQSDQLCPQWYPGVSRSGVSRPGVLMRGRWPAARATAAGPNQRLGPTAAGRRAAGRRAAVRRAAGRRAAERLAAERLAAGTRRGRVGGRREVGCGRARAESRRPWCRSWPERRSAPKAASNIHTHSGEKTTGGARGDCGRNGSWREAWRSSRDTRGQKAARAGRAAGRTHRQLPGRSKVMFAARTRRSAIVALIHLRPHAEGEGQTG